MSLPTNPLQASASAAPLTRRTFLALAGASALALCGCTKEAPRSAKEVDPRRLQNALEGIRTWLLEHSPSVAHALQPGLTSHDIERVTGNLPFAIPTEIALLYQWHNGTSSEDPFIWKHRFLPLETAIEFWAKNQSSSWQDTWFPIFLHQGDAYFIAPFGYKARSLPIRHFTLTGKEHPNTFQSLTLMMETELEWYKSRAVRVNAKGGLVGDPARMREIFERKNPGMPYPGGVD